MRKILIAVFVVLSILFVCSGCDGPALSSFGSQSLVQKNEVSLIVNIPELKPDDPVHTVIINLTVKNDSDLEDGGTLENPIVGLPGPTTQPVD